MFKYVFYCVFLRRNAYGNSLFYNARLFARNSLQRCSQIFGVFQFNLRYRAYLRQQNVCCVEPAAQARFKDNPFHAAAAETKKSEKRHKFKPCRLCFFIAGFFNKRLGCGNKSVHGLFVFRFRQKRKRAAYAFADIGDMGRQVQTRFKARFFQNGSAKNRYGPLALGACNVNRFIRVLRISESFAQIPHCVETEKIFFGIFFKVPVLFEPLLEALHRPLLCHTGTIS